ncbi:zeta toxin family protein [Microtetraspora fusca]|uniref:UDP-N-acetylglucosamine kinase n=1 Tax=Microtetraspora fusca TaxID=1997 RepID=A0ABW6VHC7_MICFU
MHDKGLRWERGGLTYTVESKGSLRRLAGRISRAWDPNKHPRDRDGQFATVGSHVSVEGHGPGVVRGRAADGGILVEDADGVVRSVSRAKVSLDKSKPDVKPDVTPDVKPDGGGHAPLTDAQYEKHTAELRQRLDKALADGLSTDKLHTKNGDGKTYTPERARQHKQIVDEMMEKYSSVPREGRALLSGGLGGAGKTTVLERHADVSSADFATINVDDVKEMMAERGMVPKVEGVAPMEGAALIHEESGHIANLLAQRLYANKTNVIWDITMASKGSTARRIKELRDAGYLDIRSVFVDIPVEESVSRALSRHRRGLERYREGKGQGGRFVPPEVIRANAVADWSSANRRNFEELKDQLEGWALFDNSVRGRAPELLDTNGWYDDPAQERVEMISAELRQIRSRPGYGSDPRLERIEQDLEEALDEAYADASDAARSRASRGRR